MSGIFGISSSYLPQLLSHQTELSITASTANTFCAIGNAISIPRNGIAVISMSGHISAGAGNIQLELTRGSNSYLYGSSYNSLFGNNGSYNTTNNITTTTSSALFVSGNFNTTSTSTVGSSPFFLLPVYSGDSLQFYASNQSANDTTYIDDVLVMLI